jgi:hypothetical protein
MPALGEVILDGQGVFARIERNPDESEAVLTSAARLAIKNRADRDKCRAPGDSGVRLELRVRRRLRNLIDTVYTYGTEKLCYEQAIQMKDQAFERLMAPPAGAMRSARSPLLDALLERVTRVADAEDQLAALWTSFRAERLALYRDLGTLPCTDWNSFYADLSTGHVAREAVPAVLPKPRADDDAPQATAPAPRGR